MYECPYFLQEGMFQLGEIKEKFFKIIVSLGEQFIQEHTLK